MPSAPRSPATRSTRCISIPLFAGLLISLAILHAPRAHAGSLTIGVAQLDNGFSYNEVNSSGSQPVGPPVSSTGGSGPGSYDLSNNSLYTGNISSSGTADAKLTSQLTTPQIVESGNDSLQASTTPGYYNKSSVQSLVFQYFTISTPYSYTLHEQATGSSNSEGAYAGGELDKVSGGTVTSWSFAATTPATYDNTVSGVLDAGTYLLYLHTQPISYTDSPQDNALSQVIGQQTVSLSPTPEPASLTLLSLGGLGLAGYGVAGYGWRRRKATVTA